jgi:hypothetical protein
VNVLSGDRTQLIRLTGDRNRPDLLRAHQMCGLAGIRTLTLSSYELGALTVGRQALRKPDAGLEPAAF